MPDLITYLLKANLSVILFYLGYRLLLRRLTFYNLNRFYLLFSLVFSFTYPLIDIHAWLEVSEQGLPAEVIYMVPDWQQVPVETFDRWTWVIGLIGIGGCWFAIRLIIRLISLRRIHQQSQPSIWQWFRYRQVFGDILPFSFWQHIYVNVHHHEPRELAEIFKHEQAHVDGVHTFDVLLVEIGSVLSWFNPVLWLMRAAVHENLEFLTDRKVLLSGVDKKAYQYSLLATGQQVSTYADIGNGFNFKSLKRRIMMMNKRNSSRLQLGKYVLAVPVIAAAVLVFTVSKATSENEGGIDPTLTEKADRTMESVIAEDALESDTSKVLSQKLKKSRPDPTEQSAKSVIQKVMLSDTSQAKSLIFVDGKEQANGTLSHLDTKTIESVSVLKDRAATALYGSRGANGVMLITTKKEGGESRQSAVSIQSEQTASKTADTIQLTNRTTSIEEKGSAGAVRLGKNPKGILYLVDGEEVSAEEVEKIPHPDIHAVDVWKGEKAVEKYGEKGKNGVMEITLKQK